MAILDLRRAYLQIRVEKLLWPFQTVEIKGTRYCLTRLGFGLNVAPSIMTTIMSAIRQQDATAIIHQLESVFLECGPSTEILTDNGTAFTSEQFRKFADSWGACLRFRCAYVPSGNGIIERNYRTVKTIAARKDCTVSEAVYWYNITPKDDVSPSTAPADALHRYHVRVKGIETNPLLEREVSGERIKEGDVVWVKKKTCSKCTTRYGTGHVTEVISPQSVRIDGVPHHIKDLQPAMRLQPPVSDESESESETNEPSLWFTPAPSGSDSDISSLPGNAVFLDSQTTDESTSEDETHVVPPQRSTRRRQSPPPCPLCDHEIRGECDGNHENGEGSLPFRRPRVCVIQTGKETKKFKMAPVTFYHHLIS